MKGIKGYKAFHKDMTCRSMQYEIGKEYKMEGKPELCKTGYHFCKTIADCYRYYNKHEDTIICEIRALGEIVTDDIKFCTNHILIVRKINNPKEKTNVSISSGYCNAGNQNTGDYNTGDYNTGDRNSGDKNSGGWNTGDYNTGDRNTGDYNTGDRNTGDYNTGDRNTGYWNAGDRNSGDQNTGYYNTGTHNIGNENSGDLNTGYRNTGNRNSGTYNTGDRNSGEHNSGYWNAGDYSTGIFCTEKKPKIKLFDKESNWTIYDWLLSDAKYILDDCPYSKTVFVDIEDMTDDEKENHPECYAIGGYNKIILVTEKDKQKWWDSLSDEDKNTVCSLPNFNKSKFKECTGIEV